MGTIIESCAKAADKVRDICPLVHCITNYVTVNDVANCILAIGASPIMADDIAEAADITSISKALVINMGTLNARTVESMVAAGKKANELGVPVVFDPVGAGASNFRNETAKRILENVKISILRGNLSEMSYLAGLEVSTKGVDTSEADEKNDPVSVAKKTAAKYNWCGGYNNRRKKSRKDIKRSPISFKGNRHRLYDNRTCRLICRCLRRYVYRRCNRHCKHGHSRRVRI